LRLQASIAPRTSEEPPIIPKRFRTWRRVSGWVIDGSGSVRWLGKDLANLSNETKADRSAVARGDVGVP
jgi:hypothetical protein